MAELIVADAEYFETADKYNAFATQMDGYVDDYVKILGEIVSEKCIEGDVAEKLEQFSALIGQALSGQLVSVMAMQTRQMYDYITSIDEADEYLY